MFDTETSEWRVQEEAYDKAERISRAFFLMASAMKDGDERDSIRDVGRQSEQ